MQGISHIIFGTTLSLIATEWFPQYEVVIVSFAVIGSLLPDIDTKSTISCMLGFELPFKHRGFTHSLIFLLIATLAMNLISIGCAIGMFIGICSHIIGDMITGGVRLLYPKRKYYKINGIHL